MDKYDFMWIEDVADAMGTHYLEGEHEEILELCNELIIRINQIKSDIMGDKRK